ncbi:MAG: ribosome small subunit-dependent GTPase A [Sulfurimicrobium sp.]|nr:ribosome small subunit-dependent GTPase A [Sulfurimicrobium sp.]MDP1705486.1 ribosome small subunit-dependent GTPase A [Sulfurimicrobium sp.]MDP2198010.1 ribosome small subunit-dependent GTPase A [Sulfurimicrobium sp.]MDP3686264.1 ribosome small subunit-dependent GTPase A [Sulfurimicrobium sp.]
MQKLPEGQITASYGRQFTVELADGSHITCVTRGKKGGAACGDRVRIKHTGPSQGVIEAILPRQSLLYRSDAFREKIIAANVTQIIIVLAAVPSFYEDLVNRCLAAAESAKIKALIVLNKADLQAETAQALEKLTLYRDLGYALLPLSAHQDTSPLVPFLQGETSVLVGQSGMGKSSIINTLLPGVKAETREISATLDSGKHTTTHARLYHLNPDSHIIDSPGLQEFGLHHLKPEEIDHAFVEFRPYLGKCKFNNCRHISEPGCAVLAAVTAGSIQPRRLAAYQKLIGNA